MSTQLARVVAPSGFLGGTRVVGGASDGSIAARVVVVVARCCRGFTAIRVAHIIIIVVVVVGRETRSGGCAVVPSDVRIHHVVVPGHDWSIDPQTKVSWSGDVDTVMGFALCVVVVGARAVVFSFSRARSVRRAWCERAQAARPRRERRERRERRYGEA